MFACFPRLSFCAGGGHIFKDILCSAILSFKVFCSLWLLYFSIPVWCRSKAYTDKCIDDLEWKLLNLVLIQSGTMINASTALKGWCRSLPKTNSTPNHTIPTHTLHPQPHHHPSTPTTSYPPTPPPQRHPPTRLQLPLPNPGTHRARVSPSNPAFSSMHFNWLVISGRFLRSSRGPVKSPFLRKHESSLVGLGEKASTAPMWKKKHSAVTARMWWRPVFRPHSDMFGRVPMFRYQGRSEKGACDIRFPVPASYDKSRIAETIRKSSVKPSSKDTHSARTACGRVGLLDYGRNLHLFRHRCDRRLGWLQFDRTNSLSSLGAAIRASEHSRMWLEIVTGADHAVRGSFSSSLNRFVRTPFDDSFLGRAYHRLDRDMEDVLDEVASSTKKYATQAYMKVECF